MRLAAALLALCPFFAEPAAAGVLVEAQLEGVHLRLELGADRERVIAFVAGERRLVDVAGREVWSFDKGAQPVNAALLDDGATLRPYSLDRWSEGPSVAGHATSYNVMQLGEAVCAEVLTSAWMMPFVEPVKLAIGLLQRTEPVLRPQEREGCGRAAFSAYTAQGWPLAAGWRDSHVWRVDKISFDHFVAPERTRLPGEGARGAPLERHGRRAPLDHGRRATPVGGLGERLQRPSFLFEPAPVVRPLEQGLSRPRSLRKSGSVGPRLKRRSHPLMNNKKRRRGIPPDRGPGRAVASARAPLRPVDVPDGPRSSPKQASVRLGGGATKQRSIGWRCFAPLSRLPRSPVLQPAFGCPR